mgnify:CR=1 FL=1
MTTDIDNQLTDSRFLAVFIDIVANVSVEAQVDIMLRTTVILQERTVAYSDYIRLSVL